MQNQMDRTLTILADDEHVTGYARARLLGAERLGLYPSLFMLHLWNVAEEDYILLSRCKEVMVLHKDVVLVSGTVSDAFRHLIRPSGTCLGYRPFFAENEHTGSFSGTRRTPSRGRLSGGTETLVAIAPGLKLWEAPVSLSVESGVTVSETVRWLLGASGTGIHLLSFPGEDPVTTRGQAFFGRAAECIEEALGKAGARCCLVPSGLCVVPKEGLPVSMVLTEEDLTDVPSFNCGGDMVLRTGPAGWTLGKGVEVRYGGTVNRGLISERMINLETGDGAWRVEVVVELNQDE